LKTLRIFFVFFLSVIFSFYLFNSKSQNIEKKEFDLNNFGVYDTITTEIGNIYFYQDSIYHIEGALYLAPSGQIYYSTDDSYAYPNLMVNSTVNKFWALEIYNYQLENKQMQNAFEIINFVKANK
jgi:hypothetical protein